LDSDDWSQLAHAYGAANDTPDLLAKLADYPSNDEYDAEPFFSLWSSLCHQGDTYTAAYAAVPHMIRFAEAEPERITYDFLLLPTSIEIARLTGRGPEVPDKLRFAYETAIQSMPRIVGQLRPKGVDETMCLACGAAIAVAAGNATMAEAILELEGEAAAEFLKWKFDQ
jgi:hypothetical protein